METGEEVQNDLQSAVLDISNDLAITKEAFEEMKDELETIVRDHQSRPPTNGWRQVRIFG